MISDLTFIEHDEICGYGLYKNNLSFAQPVNQGGEHFIITQVVLMCNCLYFKNYLCFLQNVFLMWNSHTENL